MKKHPRILISVDSERTETDCACPSEHPENDLRWRLTEAERKLMSIQRILAETGLCDSDDPEELAEAAADFCKYRHLGADTSK